MNKLAVIIKIAVTSLTVVADIVLVEEIPDLKWHFIRKVNCTTIAQSNGTEAKSLIANATRQAHCQAHKANST